MRRRSWPCARSSSIPTRSARAPSSPRVRRRSTGTSSTPSRWKRRGGSAKRRRRPCARSSSIAHHLGALELARRLARAGKDDKAYAVVDRAARRRSARRRARRRVLSRGGRDVRAHRCAPRGRRRLARGPRSHAARRRRRQSSARGCSGRALRRGQGSGPARRAVSRIGSITCAAPTIACASISIAPRSFYDGGDRDGAEQDLRAALDLDR